MERSAAPVELRPLRQSLVRDASSGDEVKSPTIQDRQFANGHHPACGTSVNLPGEFGDFCGSPPLCSHGDAHAGSDARNIVPDSIYSLILLSAILPVTRNADMKRMIAMNELQGTGWPSAAALRHALECVSGRM